MIEIKDIYFSYPDAEILKGVLDSKRKRVKWLVCLETTGPVKAPS